MISIPQMYYWRVDFADGTHLAQFDDFGNEILIKNIAGSECFNHKGEIIEFSNYFGRYEQIHGPAVHFGFYPFTETMMQKIHVKDPSIVFATSEQALPITKAVPPQQYVSFKKENHISYGLSVKEPIGRLGKITIALVGRKTPDITTYEINLVQVAT